MHVVGIIIYISLLVLGSGQLVLQYVSCPAWRLCCFTSRVAQHAQSASVYRLALPESMLRFFPPVAPPRFLRNGKGMYYGDLGYLLMVLYWRTGVT